MAEKNMIIAMVLSFILTGIGNVYNGLTTRGAVEFIINCVLGILNLYVSPIFLIINIIWWIYVLYDTYVCTNAINNNQAIPLLLTQIDLQ